MHTYHCKSKLQESSKTFPHKIVKCLCNAFFWPNHIASDFCLFTSKPETQEKLFIMDNAWDISYSFSKNKVMSSAYKAIFNTCSKSVPFTTSRRVIPLIPLQSLIFYC